VFVLTLHSLFFWHKLVPQKHLFVFKPMPGVVFVQSGLLGHRSRTLMLTIVESHHLDGPHTVFGPQLQLESAAFCVDPSVDAQSGNVALDPAAAASDELLVPVPVPWSGEVPTTKDPVPTPVPVWN
jgi:hypothetical protein